MNRRLADTVRSDQHDVGGVVDEVEGHQIRHGGLVALLGPIPVEVGQGFEPTDVRRVQSSLQTALLALTFFPLQQRLQPGELWLAQFVPVSD